LRGARVGESIDAKEACPGGRSTSVRKGFPRPVSAR
jgi:hypothetical protein